MLNSYFQFKQFIVKHDRCAMKVGTDGVLLGAWCNIDGANSILDVGTGSGLIALMLAQRSSASIVALELDHNAAIQAEENFVESSWSDRLCLIHSNFLFFNTDKKFDLIVSNPPYFENSLISPCEKRTLARHTETLSLRSFLVKSIELLSQHGIISIIIPVDIEFKLQQFVCELQLFVIRKTYVLPKPNSKPKRLLVELSRNVQNMSENNLVIELSRHVYSDSYVALTKDFYLKM